MSEIGRKQHQVLEIQERIKELQEIAEELEESFPRGDTESDKNLNAISRKLTDRLSAAHDLSLKLGVELATIRIEKMHNNV